ncbi:hypothetical protein ACQY0O_003910 [Thecaphora frezii]
MATPVDRPKRVLPTVSRTVYRALRVASFNPLPHSHASAKGSLEDPDKTSADGIDNDADADEAHGALTSAADELLRVSQPLADTHHHLATLGTSLLLPQRRPTMQPHHLDPELARGAPRSVDDAVEKVRRASRRRQKLRRLAAGARAFLGTWEGMVLAVYGGLVVISGSALVLFLLGWIDHGHNKEWWVEFWSQFVNALFTIPGVGLIPWRARDTWDICWIAHYQHTTWRLRRERGWPPLEDKHEIPTVPPAPKDGSGPSKSTAGGGGGGGGIEARELVLQMVSSDDEKVQVLSAEQARRLQRLQRRLQRTQPWYRPEATVTRRAFPIGTAMVVMLLLDMNSVFQCLLCAAMWGYASHYRDRPAWMTAVLIVLSFLCGIVAGVLIVVGTERTKRKEKVRKAIG